LSDNLSAEELALTITKLIDERKPQNVKQLVTLVKAIVPLSEKQILDIVLKLQSQGKIKLGSYPLPVSAKSALWYWATIALAIVTVAVVFTVPEDLYPWNYLRNVLGIIFVLWLPGYAVTKALFPTQMPIKTSTETLDSIERIALSIGMSIAIVPIIGLILYYTPWGINLAPIVLSLFALTLISASAALAREKQNKTENP
jgi:hypothetical protein